MNNLGAEAGYIGAPEDAYRSRKQSIQGSSGTCAN
jgi:hypothetical protein